MRRRRKRRRRNPLPRDARGRFVKQSTRAKAARKGHRTRRRRVLRRTVRRIMERRKRRRNYVSGGQDHTAFRFQVVKLRPRGWTVKSGKRRFGSTKGSMKSLIRDMKMYYPKASFYRKGKQVR